MTLHRALIFFLFLDPARPIRFSMDSCVGNSRKEPVWTSVSSLLNFSYFATCFFTSVAALLDPKSKHSRMSLPWTRYLSKILHAFVLSGFRVSLRWYQDGLQEKRLRALRPRCRKTLPNGGVRV